jgi:DNA repair photolyase
MQPEQEPIRGRGAAGNPPNRFELIHYERDPEAPCGDGGSPATQLFRDNSRSIIASNDSPDVGFEKSVNPYRGCEHGCVYCLSGETPILMADGRVRRLEDIRVADAIYGTERRGWYRRYVKTRVLAHWSVTKPAYRVQLGDGTVLIAGPDHRFLTQRGWKYVTGTEQGRDCRPHLTICNKLMGTGAFAAGPQMDEDYRRGYLCGLIRGDALLGDYQYARRPRGGGSKQHQFRLALINEEALERGYGYLEELGVPTRRFLFQAATAGRKEIRAIRTHAGASVARIRALIDWPSARTGSWSKGFLAGIFDAEGSYSEGVLRISNTESAIIGSITRCLKWFGFSYMVERPAGVRKRPIEVVRVCGGLREHLRFFHTFAPAISRKWNIEGQAVKNSADLRVVGIEPFNASLQLFDITTGTGDFIANGIVSHNCYARPTHEYLGFSAGLDFETKIMVKEDAPQLLRAELASPRWRPQAVSLCGVTDAYQPVERRLQLTRRCLEVFAEFRNPVGVVTKNHLVTRDRDLLGELARFQAAAVFLSITTLDGELARVLEPRATQPAGRLDALRELTGAGIPTGVFVAPVIPGLNDHEIPAILQAAADAGAGFAGYVLLRLPHAVAPLFEQWLQMHFPDRKDKVLGRLRQLRGGRLNDARFGSRMRGEGPLAEAVRSLFHLARRRAGMRRGGPALSTAAFRRPGGNQLLLFE